MEILNNLHAGMEEMENEYGQLVDPAMNESNRSL